MDDTVKRALSLLRQGIAGTKEVELVIAYIKQLETRIQEFEQREFDMHEAKDVW